MPIYDLDALKRGRAIVADNILSIEQGLIDERKKLAQYDHQISEAEKILRAHNIPCHADQHDWEILATFPDGRTWKRRSCRKCSTRQKLGN